MAKKIEDLTGWRFGRWTVLRMDTPLVTVSGRRRLFYSTCLCRCDCGTERIVRAASLRQGQSRSCGCSRLNPLRGAAVEMPPEVIRKAPGGYVPAVEVSDDEWMFGYKGSKGLFAAR